MSIQGYWISTDGELIPTGLEWGHIKYAESIGKTERELELLGYAKIHVYHEAVTNQKEFTQKQVDTLFDFMLENNYETSELPALIDKHQHLLYFNKL